MAKKPPHPPFDSESGKKAARRSAEVRRPREPTKQVGIRIYARQHEELLARGINLSKLVREVLDERLGEKAPKI